MGERILALAAEIVGGEPTELLRALCGAAETAWRGRLCPGVEVEDCGEAFACAAALSAAADYLAGQGSGVTSFTAGEVSVRTGGGGAPEALRQAAARLMAPYGRAERFDFRGVPG